MTHVNIGKQHSDTYQQMAALSAQADASLAAAGLSPLLAELVRIRVSQINGCAFCLRLHAREAIAKGETTDRLAVVAAWWESQYFTPAEQAALALAEQVTQLNGHQPRSAHPGALSDEQVSAVTWLAIAVNAWNRVAITSHYPVGS